MSFLRVEKVVKHYEPRVVALRDLSLTIERGEWITLMGPSGSGKSTLVHLMAGLDRPTEGKIWIDGTELTALSGAGRVAFRRENVGIVFQQMHLVPYLTALENVMLAQYFHSLPERAEAVEVLRRVGLEDRLTHRPGQLSGGEQQRVCLARAWVNRPKLLLADEPTANLDEENQRRVLDLLAERHREGQTIVVVTHDPALARRGDRTLELRHGAIVGSALTREDEETFDEVLQQLWERHERNPDYAECADHPLLLENLGLLRAMAERDLVERRSDGFELTACGEARARDVIRRHRLAERLFQDTLHIRGEQIESNACQFEHILSPEVTEGICAFLGHPHRCPHGRPIPTGGCCPSRPS